jgi:hypothetical protein
MALRPCMATCRRHLHGRWFGSHAGPAPAGCSAVMNSAAPWGLPGAAPCRDHCWSSSPPHVSRAVAPIRAPPSAVKTVLGSAESSTEMQRPVPRSRMGPVAPGPGIEKSWVEGFIMAVSHGLTARVDQLRVVPGGEAGGCDDAHVSSSSSSWASRSMGPVSAVLCPAVCRA